MKTAVGFMLPSAGVTPAPIEKKSQNGEDAIYYINESHFPFPSSFEIGLGVGLLPSTNTSQIGAGICY